MCIFLLSSFFFRQLSPFFFLGVLRIAVKSRFRPEISGKKALIGEKCTSIENFQGKGRVKVNSEIWWATSPGSVKEGEVLLIVDVSGLTLRVKPILEEKTCPI